MSVSLLIACPPSPSDWSTYPDGLAAAILRRWPEARTERDPRPGTPLEWRMELVGEELQGRLAEDGRTVALEGRPEAGARSAHWYRSIVPPEQPLVLFDDAHADHAGLSPATTHP